MKPVRQTAHLTFSRPKTLISVVAMRWAPPLSAMSLPSMAPKETTMARPPRVPPSPFSMVGMSLSIGMPSARPTAPATRSRARKLLSFTLTMRKNKTRMPMARMTSGIMRSLLYLV